MCGTSYKYWKIVDFNRNINISASLRTDYIFDEYKNYLIASHKNSVPQKSIDNVIIVYDNLDIPDYDFYIGLDDSKGSCDRKMDPDNIDNAREYSD